MELKSIKLQVFLFHSCCLLRTNLATSNLFIVCLPLRCYHVYIKLSKTKHLLLSSSDHSLSTYMLLSEEGDKTPLHLLPVTFTFWLLCAQPSSTGSVWNHFHDSRYSLFKYVMRPWHFVGWLELKPLCQSVAKLHFLTVGRRKQSKGGWRYMFSISYNDLGGFGWFNKMTVSYNVKQKWGTRV